MKAIWELDYDFQDDLTYKRPCCPDCKAPIGKIFEDGKYHCYSCGEIVEVVDPAMQKWLSDREYEKVEIEDCFPDSEIEIRGEKFKMGCGGKGTVKVKYVKNPITLKWRAAGGKCEKCGMSWIV